MAKANVTLQQIYNSSAACSVPPLSSLDTFAVSAFFYIYEAGAVLAAVADGCRDIPEMTGTLVETVDLSGVLPVFLSSSGVMYDYPELVLTTPTVARLVVRGVSNGQTVEFVWYQTYNVTNPWPPTPIVVGEWWDPENTWVWVGGVQTEAIPDWLSGSNKFFTSSNNTDPITYSSTRAVKARDVGPGEPDEYRYFEIELFAPPCESVYAGLIGDASAHQLEPYSLGSNVFLVDTISFSSHVYGLSRTEGELFLPDMDTADVYGYLVHMSTGTCWVTRNGATLQIPLSDPDGWHVSVEPPDVLPADTYKPFAQTMYEETGIPHFCDLRLRIYDNELLYKPVGALPWTDGIPA